MTQLNAIVRGGALAALLAASGLCSADAGAIHNYRGLAMNAAGDRVATIESLEGDRAGGRIVVRSSSDGKIVSNFERTAACANCRLDGITWSPDGKAMAMIGTDAKAGTATVYVLRDGKFSVVTTVKGIANTVRWSPDGRQLAFLATVGAKKLTGAVEAGERQIGEIGLAQNEDEQRVAVVAASGGEARLVSPSDTFVYEYDWTPDGRGFVVTSAKGNGDNNWWVATLGHVDAASGALRTIAAPKMQMNMPHVSPDGSTVAFIGGLMSDFGSIGGDVYTVPLAGGQPVDVTPDYRATVNGITWRGKSILASVLAGADATIAEIDPVARTNRTLWHGPVSAAASRDGHFAFSADGQRAAAVLEDYEHAPYVVAGSLPELKAITTDNAGFAATVSSKNITWTNDGYHVQGWLIGPRKVEQGKTYPMIVMVHGGPSAAVTPRYVSGGEGGGLTRDLVQQGYFVFMPNPRGSYGQGEAFTSANRKDFGRGDWSDILAGVDAVIKAAPVDGNRLGLMGHSYGGYMTMWGVTHSTRFKAAVAGAGIANWISYYGQNGIDTWMVPFFGATMYDDPAVYRAASPIENIKAAKTPTLVYVGERDVECPPAQSFEFWHGLRAMNVPTTLLVYDGEGHAFRKPDNQKDLRGRELAWFAKYLK